MKLYSLLTLSTLFISLSSAKRIRKPQSIESNDVKIPTTDDELIIADAVAAAGALRVGRNDALVPDASAEHPMIISNPGDQPLCKPNDLISSSRPLKTMEGYETFVLTNKIKNPRKIIIDPANHLLVISPEDGLYSVRMDKCGNTDVKLILSNSMMDQPIAEGVGLFNNHVFVTTANSVYKFPYSDGQHSTLENGVKVIHNINPDDASATPDIAIDPFGHAFVPHTVKEIHDKLDQSQAFIKKFNLKLTPESGFNYATDGEVQAYGTNTFGIMGFDAQARLWGINGVSSSEIKRNDISADKNLVGEGLAEELNLYEFPKTNFGFPYCMTEYNMASISSLSKGLGAQWAHPTFMNDSVKLDEYCEDESNNRRPSVPLAPNTIATSVYFYMGTFCSVGDLNTGGTSVGLPCNWTDTPILANHGLPGQSSGHNVVHLAFDDVGHKPRWDKEPEVLLQEEEPCSGEGCISPYGLAVDSYGRLIVSSDETNEIFILYRKYNEHAVKLLTDAADADEGPDDESSEDDE